MTLPLRHRQIIAHLDQFSQLSFNHIRELVFSDCVSRTPCDRALKTLLDDGYVARLDNRRNVGGVRGGSGQNIFVLGRQGWTMTKRQGRYYKPVSANYHALAISDVAVRLHVSERAGEVVVRSVITEPECWLNVQGNDLRPDLSIELERPGTGARLSAFIEVDLGTERQSRITEKLTRYMDAYRRATRADMEELRRIVFVSENEPRRAEIEWLVGRLPEDQRKYFRSVTLDSFPQSL